MKTKINLIIIVFIISLLGSCESNFLERHPTYQPTSETFWNSENDARMALIGVYSRLYADPFGAQRRRLETLTDNARSSSILELYLYEIVRGIVYPSQGGVVTNWYSGMYVGIGSCNFFLDNIDKVDDFDLKKQYIAEVKFFRAWFYFQLQQTYGGVIIYRTSPTSIEDAKIAKSSSEEVIDFILEDLDAAIPDLPNSKYTGRVVKNTAIAFKSKVLLFTEQWTEAANAAKDVINSGLCNLYPNYRELFLNSGQITNPSEILLSTCYSFPDRFHYAAYDILIEGYSYPRMELADAYLCTDGLPTNESSLFNPDEPYLNRDPRLKQTIITVPYRVAKGDTIPISSTEKGEISWNKTVSDELPYSVRPNSQEDFDIVLLRYADVLLMYAEAQNESAGPDQTVYEAVNEVRRRSGMPPVNEGLTVDEMRETIRLERRIELAGEGHRWYDIKRWKIAHEVLPLVETDGDKLKMEAHQYIWPFPQTEIDNNPNLIQNPGYN
jgi:hypothetical protein